jgi:hypothetical protein
MCEDNRMSTEIRWDEVERQIDQQLATPRVHPIAVLRVTSRVFGAERTTEVPVSGNANLFQIVEQCQAAAGGSVVGRHVSWHLEDA